MSDRQVATKETRRQIRPLSSMAEENGAIQLRMEMPGVPKDGVELEVEGSELRIRGRRHAPQQAPRYLLRERVEGDYYEVYTLDETVDRGKIEAAMDSGVLNVTLHLREAEKPRKIQITSR